MVACDFFTVETASNRSSIARLRACWRIQRRVHLAGVTANPDGVLAAHLVRAVLRRARVARELHVTVVEEEAHVLWARRNSLHDGPRRGAGPKPERLRIDLIVVAPTLMPSLRNSPWMRTQPQLGFSRPRRNTSSRIAGSSGGRPGDRRRYVHFLAMSSRCQRNSVCGETRNTDQRSRGSSLLAAASSIRSRRPSGGRFTVRPNTAS